MKLSIIVPVYNAEKYIVRCLESIQKLENIDWECILVNDGSTDCSLQILKSYQNKNERFVVIDIPNAGVSNARNIGIDNAKGDVCFFLDADDELDSKADIIMKQALDNFRSNSLVLFGYYKEMPDGRKVLYSNSQKEVENYADGVKELAIISHRLNSCWGKIYDCNTIREYAIRFDNTMKIGEDSNFVMDYLRHSREMQVYEEPILIYYYSPSGAMRNAGMTAFEDEKKTFEKRQQLIKEFGIEMTQDEYARMCKLYCNMLMYYTIMESTRKNYFQMVKLSKKYFSYDFVRFVIEHVSWNDFKKLKVMMIKLLRNQSYYLFVISVYLVSRLNKKYRSAA